MDPVVYPRLFAPETPFSFYSDRSATRGWYITINVANENLMSFHAVFKLFHVCICNRFDDTLISHCPNNLW
jgi:hypothetical protein